MSSTVMNRLDLALLNYKRPINECKQAMNAQGTFLNFKRKCKQ